LYHKLGDYTAGEKHYQLSLNIEKSLGSQTGVVLSILQLGRLALDKRDIQAAAQHFQEAFALSEIIGYQFGAAKALFELGMLEIELKDFSKAEKYFLMSLSLSQVLVDPHLLINTGEGLCIVAISQGKLEDAEVHLQSVLVGFDKFGKQLRDTDAYLRGGILAQLLGKLVEAKNLYRSGLAICEETGNKSGYEVFEAKLSTLEP
jgi:tetratricopeptide (TPR) repeat protein